MNKVSGVLLGLSLFAQAALALDPAGTIKLTKGDVQILDAKAKVVADVSGKLPRSVSAGAPFYIGETVITKADGRVKLEFVEGKNEVVLGTNTALLIERASTDPLKATGTSLSLARGEVRSSVNHKYSGKGTDSYQVKTPNAVAGVRGTVFMAKFNPMSMKSEVATERGLVAVKSLTGGGGEVMVKPGMFTAAVGSTPATPPALTSTNKDLESSVKSLSNDANDSGKGDASENSVSNDRQDSQQEAKKDDSVAKKDDSVAKKDEPAKSDAKKDEPAKPDAKKDEPVAKKDDAAPGADKKPDAKPAEGDKAPASSTAKSDDKGPAPTNNAKNDAAPAGGDAKPAPAPAGDAKPALAGDAKPAPAPAGGDAKPALAGDAKPAPAPAGGDAKPAPAPVAAKGPDSKAAPNANNGNPPAPAVGSSASATKSNVAPANNTVAAAPAPAPAIPLGREPVVAAAGGMRAPASLTPNISGLGSANAAVPTGVAGPAIVPAGPPPAVAAATQSIQQTMNNVNQATQTATQQTFQAANAVGKARIPIQ